MSYFDYSLVRTMERSPARERFTPRPLSRRNSKRARTSASPEVDDNSADDYPYSTSWRPARPSRALTFREQPSQLERYNIWSDRRKSEEKDVEVIDRRRSYEHTRTYRHSSSRYRDVVSDDDAKYDPEDRKYGLTLAATISRSKPVRDTYGEDSVFSSRSSRRIKQLEEELAVLERLKASSQPQSRPSRLRRDSFWGEGGFWGNELEDKKIDEDKSFSRSRRIKRTKTDEWRLLSGWH